VELSTSDSISPGPVFVHKLKATGGGGHSHGMQVHTRCIGCCFKSAHLPHGCCASYGRGPLTLTAADALLLCLPACATRQSAERVSSERRGGEPRAQGGCAKSQGRLLGYSRLSSPF